MGVLLLLAVVALAFLCGRLQVSCTRLAKDVEAMKLEVTSLGRWQGVRDLED